MLRRGNNITESAMDASIARKRTPIPPITLCILFHHNRGQENCRISKKTQRAKVRGRAFKNSFPSCSKDGINTFSAWTGPQFHGRGVQARVG
eukprot:3678993-Rhodomonas_salina.5